MKPNPRIFVFDPLWSGLLSAENKQDLNRAGCEITHIAKGSSLAECPELFSDKADKVLAINPDYVGWKLAAAQFQDIKNLRCIITQSTSYGWIDTEFASSKNIAVCNIRNFSTDAVADWAIMMMLNLARRIPLLIKAGFPLNFDSDFVTFRGINLKGKTAGIVGLGNIGAAIAERCAGLGMRALYWNRSAKYTPWIRADLTEIFSSADVVFPCLADTPQTKEIITDQMLGKILPSAMMVSIVHKSYNHALVLDQVKNNQLFGYGFEASAQSFQQYPGNVWAAPAYAWCTDGSMRKAMDAFVDAIVQAANGRYPNRVN